MKVLIVDDNQNILHVLEKTLKKFQYDVVTACTGKEALEKLQTGRIDLIISDTLMPVMDGFELCRNVKGNETLKTIPFIFYTATYTDEKDEKFALKLGADRYLRKPMEPEKFIKAIKDVISAKKSGKAKPAKLALKESKEIFKLYSERLVNKLEKKMLDLEREIAKRQLIEKKLKESERELQKIFDVVPLGIGLIVNRELRWSNDRMYEMLGYPNRSLFGKNARSLYENDNEYSRAGKIAYEMMRKNGIGEVETQWKRKDNSLFDCLIRVVPLNISNPSEGNIAVVSDITNRKQTEEELDKHRKYLEEMVEERTAELKEKNVDLERMNKLFVGREFRIKELRTKVKELENKLVK